MGATVIGSNTRIEGKILGDDPIIVRGAVKGDIDGNGMVEVDTSGKVEAKVKAYQLIIKGNVNGVVTGLEKVEILSGARMVGDVKTPRILISDGAIFKGRVDMEISEV